MNSPAQQSEAREFATEQGARAAIVTTCQQLDAAQLNTGRAGNLSLAWHRGGRAGILITPSAVRYDTMSPDDIVWLAIDPIADPSPEQASGLAPSSEWHMHVTLYADHSQTGSVLHVHSPYATTLACLPRVQNEGIPAFHYMIAVAGGDDIRCARYQTFGTEALSESMSQAMSGRKACLLANHGLIVMAQSLSGAFELAREVEELSRVYWQALQLGEPVVLNAGQMDEVHRQFARSAYRAPDH